MISNIEFKNAKETEGLKNILIVEDDEVDALLLSVRVASLYPDYAIISATSVSDAYQKLRHDDFSLVLLDLNLPDGYGPRTVAEIRKFNKKVPLIVVTGMGGNITVNEALKMGAHNVVLKSSISDEDFKNILDQNLGV